MKTNSSILLSQLKAITQANILHANEFKSLDLKILNSKTSDNSWSILECLEHLNRYDAFYLPAIETHLANNTSGAAPFFNNGFVGGYLVNSIIPNDKSKKIKTFDAMNPSGSNLTTAAIDIFIEGQNKLLKQLEEAAGKNLNKAGIPVTFTKLITLKLGDALRFMVYHNQRHIQQAQKIAAATA